MVTNFKKNKKVGGRKRYTIHIIGFFILCVAGFLIVANINIWHKKQQLSSKVASLQKEIKNIEDNNNKLQQGIASQSDDQYIEKVAREELDLQKPGEQAVSFIDQKIDVQEVDTAKQNFFQKIWNWIVRK